MKKNNLLKLFGGALVVAGGALAVGAGLQLAVNKKHYDEVADDDDEDDDYDDEDEDYDDEDEGYDDDWDEDYDDEDDPDKVRKAWDEGFWTDYDTRETDRLEREIDELDRESKELDKEVSKMQSGIKSRWEYSESGELEDEEDSDDEGDSDFDWLEDREKEGEYGDDENDDLSDDESVMFLYGPCPYDENSDKESDASENIFGIEHKTTGAFDSDTLREHADNIKKSVEDIKSAEETLENKKAAAYRFIDKQIEELNETRRRIDEFVDNLEKEASQDEE